MPLFFLSSEFMQMFSSSCCNRIGKFMTGCQELYSDVLAKKNPESNKGFQGLTFNQISLVCYWWRLQQFNCRL